MCPFAKEYVPSLHFAVAPSGAPAADDFGVCFGCRCGAGVGDGVLLGAAAGGGGGVAVEPLALYQVFTPPCFAHAPRSVFACV